MADEVYVSDCGLFIGLVTEPHSNGDFFRKEFERGLFLKYKDQIESNLPNDGKLSENLYVPIPYRIFGEYNLAILSLVDDFDFGLQVFKPTHGYNTENEYFTYNTQVVNGIATSSHEKLNLEQIAYNAFIQKENRLPFIGITKIKINNGILIGNGVDLIEGIKDILRSRIPQENHTIIIIDTFCNNELTLLNFSDNITSIIDYVSTIRKLQLKNIENCSHFAKKCFFKTIPLKNGEGFKLEDAHLFSETNTLFGFHYNLEKIHVTPYLDEKIRVHCTWEIKPGHEGDFNRSINSVENLKNISKLKGTKNFFAKYTVDQTFDVFDFNAKNHAHIKSFKTKILKRISDLIHPADLHEHPQLTKYLIEKFTFKRDELSTIRKALENCAVPKQTIERVLNMFNNFNNCIIDGVFFGLFIELRGFLLDVARIIKEEDVKVIAGRNEIQTGNFNEQIDNCIRGFEAAYQNRFHQSNKLNSIPNYSLEFNGGIQQFVSIFDAVYKSIMNPFGANKLYYDFVHISGYEKTHLLGHTLKINTQHIINPELFSTIIFKEATNFAFEKAVVNKEKCNDYIARKRSELFGDLNSFLNDNEKIYDNIILKLKEKREDEFEDLIQVFNKELLFSIISDIIVFNYAYNRDEMMLYWYWSYFTQMQHHKDHEIITGNKVFKRSLIRLYCLGNYIDGINAANETSSAPDRFRIVEKKKKDSFIEKRLPVLKRLDKNGFDNFSKTLLSILKTCKIAENPKDELLLSAIVFANWIADIAAIYEFNNTVSVKDLSDEERTDEFDLRDTNILNNRNSFKNRFIDAKVINDFAIDGEIPDSQFVIAILISFLECLFNLNENKTNILDTVFPKIEIGVDRQIRLSRNGNAIIYNSENRRICFTYRSVFYKSLWDFSSKIKTNYFGLS